ncbi:MAG: YggS family pyridoxal phosphate-dependent enzyme [Rhodobacteraceae bacterium]|nr:YggS family pyridoxal phosphate-dependent enzyme [Paracoccaceae bacterium]
MSLAEMDRRIRKAEKDAGREQGSTCLLAISKLQPVGRIRAVLGSGHTQFGENRVQEAASKWPELMDSHPGVSLHLVGPLQSNKVRQAMKLFRCIHSLDRPKLARRIADVAQEIGQCPDLFIQVNTGEEAQKSGVIPDDLDRLVSTTRQLELPVVGLMCIPPVGEEAALHFGLLANLAERNGLNKLSMGMSGDFETAIALGATHVRIGTAVFGERPQSLAGNRG